MWLLSFLTIGCILGAVYGDDCIPRKFDEDSVVCVCNATYCDSVAIQVPEKGSFRSYTSTVSGQRLHREDGIFKTSMNNEIVLRLDLKKKYQTIHGFGGAFTDSAGLNINSLSEETQQKLMQTYFGRDGNRYNLGRVTIGGSDFSTRGYTLDDVPGDTTLSNFSLAPEDEIYKIPYMKRALTLNPKMRFFAASWTAPPWMKVNNQYTGLFGNLKLEFYQTYANYLIKFLEIYKQLGLPMWAMSLGNEPIDGFMPFVSINDMPWTPRQQAKWLVNNLGPALEQSTSQETLLLALDDQRYQLPWWIDIMYKTADVDKYISGIAIHWYADAITPSTLLDITHHKYPDKFILNTEASCTPLPWDPTPVRLGNWHRAELYIHDIIEDMNHWVTGWVDWNLALDKFGGPNWVNNPVDSPIIVQPETDEFFKQPLYYSIAHFSKFLPRGSTRIALSSHCEIKSVAFLTPNNEVVIVLYNRAKKNKTFSIMDPEEGGLNIEMVPRSMKTIIYKR
ncbi:lysosomal acid glucosylceramidase [Diachasma alloeum]|uniref:lysosomal acid glucosylceramidase n=1 Tax=Diachasma alloeum TaxID=454923 RepID=UPI0007383750|nr:lysosomal acid glucosylceramidase [Diachasma alloeum]